jgi:glucosamine--fructose-6-phosphate aminotransferase (isomerizing)
VVGAMQLLYLIKNPNEIVAARLGSPLAIGVGEGEFYCLRCFSLLNTRQMRSTLKMVKWQILEIKPMKVVKLKMILVDPIFKLQMNLEQIEKGGYDHFMLKKFTKPSVIKDTYRGDCMLMKVLFKWV